MLNITNVTKCVSFPFRDLTIDQAIQLTLYFNLNIYNIITHSQFYVNIDIGLLVSTLHQTI